MWQGHLPQHQREFTLPIGWQGGCPERWQRRRVARNRRRSGPLTHPQREAALGHKRQAQGIVSEDRMSLQGMAAEALVALGPERWMGPLALTGSLPGLLTGS